MIPKTMPEGSFSYLSGIDWTLYAMDALSRKATGCGNLSQVILCLEKPLDKDVVAHKLSAFLKLFPVLSSTCQRHWNLAPFWSLLSPLLPQVPIVFTQVSSDESATAFLHDAVNQPFLYEHDHVRFIQVTVGAHAYFSMVFDHRIFDARGAQSFLFLFHQFFIGKFELPQPFFPVRSSGLTNWKEKFMAGQRINRRFADLARDVKVQSLPIQGYLKGKKFYFRSYTFDRASSVQITNYAYDTAGYLMMAPFFLAISMMAFKDVFATKMCAGCDFVIPVNTDIRPRNAGLQELFFNHLSFFFLKFKSQEIIHSKGTIAQVSRAMYEAMSGGFAQDLAQASFLLRIVPLRFMDEVQRRLMRLKELTFSFSYVNKGYESPDFCSSRVLNVLHTPRVAVTPGVGVFFTQFDGCISFTLAFLEGVLSAEEADLYMIKMKECLFNKFTE